MSSTDALLKGGVIGLGGLGAAASVLSGFQERRAREQAASDAREIAADKARERRREGARLKASQRVAFAASGVDPSSPTALDLRAQAARDAELDALRLQMQGDRQAQRQEALGTAALTRGILGGTGTALNTISILRRI